MIRLVVLALLMSLAVGVISGMAWGPYQGKGPAKPPCCVRSSASETWSLDRYYGNYWMIALPKAAGVHVCVRMHPNKQF